MCTYIYYDSGCNYVLFKVNNGLTLWVIFGTLMLWKNDIFFADETDNWHIILKDVMVNFS